MKSKISSAILLCLIVVSCAWGEARTFVEYPTLGECAGNNVRIRSKPSTNSEIVGKLDEYDKIVVLGRIKAQSGVWYYYNHENGEDGEEEW